MGNELFAQVAAGAFGEQGVFAVQRHAQLKLIGGLAVFAHAHVAGGHAGHGAVVSEQNLGGGKTRKDFYPQGLGLLGQPAHQLTQADDVVAVVIKTLGQQPRRRAALARGA